MDDIVNFMQSQISINQAHSEMINLTNERIEMLKDRVNKLEIENEELKDQINKLNSY